MTCFAVFLQIIEKNGQFFKDMKIVSPALKKCEAFILRKITILLHTFCEQYHLKDFLCDTFLIFAILRPPPFFNEKNTFGFKSYLTVQNDIDLLFCSSNSVSYDIFKSGIAILHWNE